MQATRRLVPALLALALATSACQLPNQKYVRPVAQVELRKLAADDASTTFDALDLGLPEIRAIAPLPDGGALLATEGGLWRWKADGTAALVAPDQKRFAALVPDGKDGFLAFHLRSHVRREPCEVWRVAADGTATRIAAFTQGTFVRAVAAGPDGAIRAIVMIDRRTGGGGQLTALEGAIWEARPGAEPTKLRDLPAEAAEAIGVPEDEQAAGVDAQGRFVVATGMRRYAKQQPDGTIAIEIGFDAGPMPTAATPMVAPPTALAVRVDPATGEVAPLEVDGHRAAIDGNGNVFGLDAQSGLLAVRGADDEPRTLLEALPGVAFPRAPGDELAIRAALGTDGTAFLAPELPFGPVSGVKRPSMAPKATTLVRIQAGAAETVMGVEGGQHGERRAGAFDLLEPVAEGTYFMDLQAVAPDGRVAVADRDNRLVRVVDAGKSIKTITWPERHYVSALALATGGVPWIAYRDGTDVPAPFPANVFGHKDQDQRLYLGKLNADGSIDRRATLVEKSYDATIDRLAVRPDGSAFAIRIDFRGDDRRQLLHVTKGGAVREIWEPGDGRVSDPYGNLNIPGCSMGLAPDGALELVAGTQHARVAAGKSTAEALPDLPVNGAHPAVDPAGRLHLVTEGPTVTRLADGAEPVDVLAGLFDPASLSYRVQALDQIGFDGAGNLFLADKRQQRLFRVPAARL